MLESAKPGFDHRVGVGDVDLGDHALERTSVKQRINSAVQILDAGVHKDVRRCRLIEVSAGFDKDVACVSGIELLGDGTGEDLP